jgi:hypothetical protein
VGAPTRLLFPGMRRQALVGGVALLVVAVAYSTTWALELYRGSLGFEDADNPATMIAFLRDHPHVYTWSGIAFVVMAVALVLAVLAVREHFAHAPETVVMRTSAVLGLFAAAFFFGQGVLRVQAPGTLMHMAGLGREWGHAAFLAVQMAGTQGFASAGGFALDIWVVGTSLAGLRHRALPRFVGVLAVAPAAQLLIGLFGPLLDPLPGAVYFLYMASILGVIVWCVAFAVLLLLRPVPPGRRTAEDAA